MAKIGKEAKKVNKRGVIPVIKSTNEVWLECLGDFDTYTLFLNDYSSVNCILLRVKYEKWNNVNESLIELEKENNADLLDGIDELVVFCPTLESYEKESFFNVLKSVFKDKVISFF